LPRLQAAALTLLEAWSAGAAERPEGALPRPSLTRLLLEIYSDDVGAFRQASTQRDADCVDLCA
jgi:hypothetical protein